jgi:hypothetical protein
LQAKRAMSLHPISTPRFVRKTQLATNEYHKNFLQIDREIIAALTSAEADQVTPLISKIYLCLVNAPAKYWEREGVLRFEAECEEGKQVKAWTALCQLLGVASATANKALTWLHEVGIIGYFAGKNGVGIRIFLNRAASSIGVRTFSGGKKILAFAPASNNNPPASQNEPRFKDTYGDLENLDSDINPGAPKNGAETNPVGKKSSEPAPALSGDFRAPSRPEEREVELAGTGGKISVSEIVQRLASELEPSINTAARRAAAREWLETKGLPKAARVAQREAYNVLRSHGLINASAQASRRDAEVGRAQPVEVEAKPLTPEEVKMFAEVCVALLETQGQAIDVTLAEISAEVGGSVLPEDAPKIREVAYSMISSTSKGE